MGSKSSFWPRMYCGSCSDGPQVFDEQITTKWRAEISQSGQDVSSIMMDWIIDELQWKAKIHQDKGAIHVFDSGVVKSDVAISQQLQQA